MKAIEIKSIPQVHQYFDQIPMFSTVGLSSVNYALENIENLAAAIGWKQDDFDCIHIAGTNGKGTTAILTQQAFVHEGYKVGLFTSPHLLSIHERFRINNSFISDEELLAFFQSNAATLDTYPHSFFELTFAIALWYFKTNKVDLAVIEVGLGGRLDATNIIDAKYAAITSISLDHTAILGNTVESIAKEKAGIIKARQQLVIGEMSKEAEDTIISISEKLGAQFYTSANDRLDCQQIAVGEFEITDEKERFRFNSRLVAPVNRKNFKMAYRLCKLASKSFPICISSILSSFENTSVPARFEQLRPDRDWYFEGGHNPEAILAVIQSLGQFDREAVIILSFMADKVNKELASLLNQYKTIYYYPMPVERAASFEHVKTFFPKIELIEQPKDLLKKLANQLVLFGGSLYFYKAVREWVKHLD